MERTEKHIFRHEHFRAKYQDVGVFVFERRFQPLFVGGYFSNQRESISRCPKSPFLSKTQNRQIAWTSPLIRRHFSTKHTQFEELKVPMTAIEASSPQNVFFWVPHFVSGISQISNPLSTMRVTSKKLFDLLKTQQNQSQQSWVAKSQWKNP